MFNREDKDVTGGGVSKVVYHEGHRYFFIVVFFISNLA